MNSQVSRASGTVQKLELDEFSFQIMKSISNDSIRFESDSTLTKENIVNYSDSLQIMTMNQFLFFIAVQLVFI